MRNQLKGRRIRNEQCKCDLSEDCKEKESTEMEKDGVLCWKCRKIVPYSIFRRMRVRNIGGKEYEYQESYGKCDVCGEEICIPGLDDENERILDGIYRDKNNLVN